MLVQTKPISSVKKMNSTISSVTLPDKKQHLIELFGHFANNISMLHIMVHMRCNATTASRAVNEELD